MESITNTEDMLCNVLILALIVNDSLKSRVWENRKHGSVGVTIALKLNSILIWSKCYGFYLSIRVAITKENKNYDSIMDLNGRHKIAVTKKVTLSDHQEVEDDAIPF